MRSLLIILVLTLSAQANPAIEQVLTKSYKPIRSAFVPSITDGEAKILIAETARILGKHVTFRPDGTQTAIHTGHTRTTVHIEWKELKISHIHKKPVNEADKLNGIQHSYFINFSCTASRTFDSKTNQWKPWTNTGYLFFPTGITLLFKNGAWIQQRESLTPFTPGPGPSILDTPQPRPTEKLPPGMSRIPQQ
jgi:hypothetical protein